MPPSPLPAGGLGQRLTPGQSAAAGPGEWSLYHQCHWLRPAPCEVPSPVPWGALCWGPSCVTDFLRSSTSCTPSRPTVACHAHHSPSEEQMCRQLEVTTVSSHRRASVFLRRPQVPGQMCIPRSPSDCALPAFPVAAPSLVTLAVEDGFPVSLSLLSTACRPQPRLESPSSSLSSLC